MVGNSKVQLKLTGVMDSAQYRQVYEAGKYLADVRSGEYSFEEIKTMPVDFEKWQRNVMEAHAGEVRDVVARAKCVVFTDDFEALWGGTDFVKYVEKQTDFKLFDVPESDPDSYRSLAKQSYLNYLRSTGDAFTWLDIKIDYEDEEKTERVVFQLYSSLCPKTVENFRRLCQGNLGNLNDRTGKLVKPHYKGTAIFRIVKDGWLQGGDVSNPGTMKAGTGGVSIYGPTFPDECFTLSNSEEGILGMANDGPHTNGSQFYVTLGRNKWMDRKYVAFGRVIVGLAHIKAIHQVPTKPNQTPTLPITVTDCGVLDIHA
eukprot:TRINITY_DN16574_c3_g1_i1.p1 TRINITY_DN16574_c3_g1~~TRINITY_DN16574_c3_g1_i1.p1  ORF type:complete len:329 (+),score=45.54 TRINITY_DN16574_c3_g1_i1:44-988(+)